MEGASGAGGAQLDTGAVPCPGFQPEGGRGPLPVRPMGCLARRLVAGGLGLACHGTFLPAVAMMAIGLHHGMTSGAGPWAGPWAWTMNSLLLLQFPLVHSALLTRRGRRLLARMGPAELGADLAPTLYVTLSALQLLLAFLLWSPSGIVWWQPAGTLAVVWDAGFAAAWLVLAKAMWDEGLAVQTGWIGWSAVWRGRKPAYGPLPRAGLYARSRQPIYLGFGLILWTGPVWTPDHLLIAVVWSAYCLLGPLHKERRLLALHGAAFERYRREVPYFLPRIRS